MTLLDASLTPECLMKRIILHWTGGRTARARWSAGTTTS